MGKRRFGKSMDGWGGDLMWLCPALGDRELPVGTMIKVTRAGESIGTDLTFRGTITHYPVDEPQGEVVVRVPKGTKVRVVEEDHS